MSRRSLVRRIYAALLHLHPAARRGFAPDMAATFDHLLASARARGRLAVVALLVRETGGLVRGMWSSHGPSVRLPAQPSRRLSAIWQDTRYALRLARRQPAFTATIVVTLGLGIGANTAIVSLANALLLQRLPFADPSRLVMLWEDISSAGFPRNTPAPGNYADWTRSIPALSGVAAIGQRDFNLTGVGDPEKIGGAGVTANLFSVLGVQPIVGRVWRPDEDVPGQHVVVLSYGLWQRRFGRDAGIVGRSVTFNDIPYTVIGVMPAGFEFISPDLQVWTPINFDAAALQNRGTHYLWVVGRMAADSTLDQLDVQLQTLATRLQRDEPATNRRVGMYAVPLRDDYLGDTRMVLALLFAAAGLVLLIACANVANLLLSRSASRARETATRAALGAPRARLIRQLLTESFLLSCVGGGLGLVVARLSFGTLTTLVPAPLVEMSHLALDWRVLATTAVVSCATAMLFGVMPALRGSRADLALGGILRSSRGAVGGPTRIGNVLVVAEIAIATVVLISAGLIATSFRAASRLPLGFAPDRVLTMQLQLPRAPFAAFDRRLNFVDEVLARVRALPGVESAGYTSAAPFVWKGGSGGFFPENLPIDRSLPYDAINRVVSPGYMETLRMSLRSGRFFDSRDTADGQPTAIINERMAREYFPGVDPIGRRFSNGAEGRDSGWRTIVGVVADTQALGLDRPAHAEMYFPLAQSARNWMWPRDLAVRSVGDPAALVAAIRTAVQEINRAQPISKIMWLDDIVATELQARRTQTSLMTAFAGIALLLAAVGIYGLLSYTVIARTTEIGVRLALGGDPSRIRRLVMRQGMTLAVVGLGIGTAGAAFAADLVEPLLFHVAPRDPWTFGLQSGVLAIVCVAAVYVPAWRASRVDPLKALRTE